VRLRRHGWSAPFDNAGSDVGNFHRFSVLGFGFWVLGSGFWVLGSGFAQLGVASASVRIGAIVRIVNSMSTNAAT
jgi:hypothetical protein